MCRRFDTKVAKVEPALLERALCCQKSGEESEEEWRVEKVAQYAPSYSLPHLLFFPALSLSTPRLISLISSAESQ